ncbi:hypothetical protein K2173_028181 [Erythroxylum novogranatense]|uniref:Pentatricopeptide repeat-containing protein n=1 Tax=Erythroxylum novogranatense TaxID=1862640 RepID=A0AAV8U448_9ROSI|nr:hypothetical protein K2173_028181 [Erythroxylum novogranatense]
MTLSSSTSCFRCHCHDLVQLCYITHLRSNFQPRVFLQHVTKLSFSQLGSSRSCSLPLRSRISSASVDPKGDCPDKFETLMHLIKRCSTMLDLKQVHAHILKGGFEHNIFLTGKVIEFCAVSEYGDMKYAVSALERIGNPDVFLWNTMIRGFSRDFETQKALEYYRRMQENGSMADSFTFSFLIKLCGQLGSNLLGKQMHCDALKRGFESHVFVRNTLIHMYGSFEEVETSRKLFDEIPSPDLVAWNCVIDCHVLCGFYREAVDIFLRMLNFGMEPDEATFVSVLSACSAMGALVTGRWVHSWIRHTRFRSILELNNSLIDMYAKCGAFREAYDTFNHMEKKNVVTWNTMILGLATNGHAKRALRLFCQMIEHKLVTPDHATFLGVLCACSHGGMVDEGRRYFDSMISEYHIQPTVKHYGCMVDLLGRAGLLEEAYRLARCMPMECNAIIWRTLLAACSLHGDVSLGKQVRSHILKFEPNHSSDCVLLANTYASAGQWNEMASIRSSMHNRGVQKPVPANSFIGMLM